MTNREPSDVTWRDGPSPAGTASDIDLTELLRTLWRGKWWIAIITAAALFIGGYYTYRIAVPKYTARAVVALESRQEKVVDLEGVVSGLSSDYQTINTEIEVLRSRSLIEKLVRKLDLTNDPEFNGMLATEPAFSMRKVKARLKVLLGFAPKRTEPSPPPTEQQILDGTVSAALGAFSVSNVRYSYVFNIQAVSTDRHKAALLANTLAELYILDQLEVKFEATEQATGWLTERVAVLQSELEAANAAVKELAAKSDLISAEALEARNRQIKETRDRVRDLRATQVQFQETLAVLTQARDGGDRENILQVAQDLTLNRIAATQGSDETFEARLDLLVDRAAQDLDRATAQADTLEQSIVQLEAEYQQQSQDLSTLQQLQREAEASRLIYEYFLGRLKETSVQEGIQQADSRILSHAVTPGGPSQPRKSRILALSAFLGLLLGTALVLLREFLHNGFRTAGELEQATGYTVMGQIPKIPSRARRGVIGYLVDKPTSAAAEAVRNLRTSVLLANVDSPPRVIMLTSSIPGEGKTTTAIALAQNFAGMGKKVVLVEGDIRKRVFNEYFDLKGTDGILSVLSGEKPLDQVVQRSDLVQADILIGEKSTTNAADVFSSERFRQLVADLRNSYDIVIVDTPPVLVVPDARVIAQEADAVLYAVEWDKTSRNQVLDGIRQFETGGVHITGLSLGKINTKSMKRYGYGGRYGAYSSYGNGYYDS